MLSCSHKQNHSPPHTFIRICDLDFWISLGIFWIFRFPETLEPMKNTASWLFLSLIPKPAIEKSRFARGGRCTGVV
jgi:hypothetical protein